MSETGPDPTPWRHASGVRMPHPHSDGAPIGGYTYDPRPGYTDYPDRFISPRSPEHARRIHNDADTPTHTKET